jgi:Rps23 Pro-64 3,4-dihydroxylase Tpa1-like proline 4-hydroxylase
MFDKKKYDINLLRKQFLNSKPFNFIIIDNFLDNFYLQQVEHELRTMPNENWYDKSTNFQDINNEPDTIVQTKKIALNIRQQIPDKSNKVIDLFSSKDIIEFIEEITDIKNLQTDPNLIGGGIHKTSTNGHLSIHCDFNIHPETQKHRRINALLYLNSNWIPSYQGELELWETDMSKCACKIPPLFNRLVIFRITDQSLHGAPEPWKAPINYPRLSFAFYYYTDDRPDNEKSNFHWALWYKRKGIDY